MIGTNSTRPKRFVRCHQAVLPLLLLASCGGGGGGGLAALGPTIVSAALIGGHTTAQPGDKLWLFVSDDVTLDANATVTDEDFTLSANATLGTISTPPTLLSSRIIELTLGTGVALVAGSSTIAWSSANDFAHDAQGLAGGTADPVPIGNSDGAAPTLSNVTIAGIDAALNGTGPAGGMLQVAPNGWPIDLTYSDNVGVDHVVITANVIVQSPAGALSSGTDLTAYLTAGTTTPTSARYTVPSSVTFPQLDTTLTVWAVDASGLASNSVSFSVRVHSFTDALRPFETSSNPSQVWYLDFDRDQESFTATPASGNAVVTANAGANGRSDFEDLLHILGLQSSTPIPGVSNGMDSNEVVRDSFEQTLLASLQSLFTGANVTFTKTRPSGTFQASSVAYSSFGYSQISIAGAPSAPGRLGVAIYDPHNDTQDDDTLFDYQGERLGIFIFTLVEVGMQQSAATLFRITFDPFAPSVGGTPIGDDAQDGQRLAGSLSDGRAVAIANAIDSLARFTAVVVAHECGHSMGLVENGAMPAGLYGNDPVNFPGSSDGHIDNGALFPSGATNVMSPSLSYSSTLHASTAFNTLNLAYLREQIFYGN